MTSSGGRYRYEDDQETPDTQTVCLEFEDRRQITWEGLSCNKHDRKFVTFYGEGGALDLDGNGTYTVFDANDKEVGKFGSPSVGDIEHIVNLLDAIRNDKPLSLNAEIAEGHKSTLLCHLGNIAQRTGRTLTCDAQQRAHRRRRGSDEALAHEITNRAGNPWSDNPRCFTGVAETPCGEYQETGTDLKYASDRRGVRVDHVPRPGILGAATYGNARRIGIKGFRSIKEASLELSSLNVLIGANGSGKSNFVSFFKMLNEMMGNRLQQYIGTSGRAQIIVHSVRR